MAAGYLFDGLHASISASPTSAVASTALIYALSRTSYASEVFGRSPLELLCLSRHKTSERDHKKYVYSPLVKVLLFLSALTPSPTSLSRFPPFLLPPSIPSLSLPLYPGHFAPRLTRNSHSRGVSVLNSAFQTNCWHSKLAFPLRIRSEFCI
jgi:hypothetical protein